MWRRMFRDALEVQDGHVRPPNRPGLGRELNEEALAPFRTG
jgi:L-alanine-DL-glutamate epimerase-like enolase superfamily enzyme